jgi:hypothetical protein
MRRSKELQEKRKEFVDNYIHAGLKEGKQMKVLSMELQERLFVTERTIYNIYCS